MTASYGHMNYFNVVECGLYRYDDPNPHGCELSETFKLIQSWVSGRALADTLPWDANISRGGLAKCYCHDIYHDETTDDYLLVLWKSDSTSTGGIWGAQENGTTGSGKVVKYTDNYRGTKVIWGRPCYYWIVPSMNTVVSIKFDFSLCDSNLFQAWVGAAITNRVQVPNRKLEWTDGGHARIYVTDGSKDSNTRFRYGFDVALKTVSTSAGELGKLASKVTHILRRDTVTLAKAKDERAAWVKFFDNVPYLAPKLKSQRRQIEVRAEAKPTASEMRAIIDQFANEDRKRADWENVGFETEDGQTIWVDRYRIKSGISVSIDLQGPILNAATLYEEISQERATLLAPLKPKRNVRAA